MVATGKGLPAGGLDNSLYHLLKRAAQVAADIFSEQAGSGNLTQRQYVLLHALSQCNGASQMQLVKLTGIDRSTLADMARRLEERGLIRRRNSQRDKRAKSLHLTRRGQEALRGVEPLMKAVDERMLSMLDAEQRSQFVEALKKIIRADGMIGQNGADMERSAHRLKDMAGIPRRQPAVAPFGMDAERDASSESALGG